MTLLQPLALAALAAIPIIILFYILRARHRQQPVSSTMFWRLVTSDLEGRPAKRIPLLNLLLILQVLIALALAVALSRPAVVGGEKRNIIVILDTSVSMQATDVAPSRFDEAKRQAQELIKSLNRGDEVSLIRAGVTPSVLESSTGEDLAPVLAALANTTAASGSVDMFSAIAMGTSLAAQTHDFHNEIVVFSDGTFPEVDLKRLGSPAADIRMQTIGQSNHNLAVTELSVRPMLGIVGRHVGFIRVTNYADVPAATILKTSADGIQLDQRAVQLPPRGAAELTVNLPAGTRLVEVSVDSEDFLKADNSAQAVVGAERQLDVVLVSANPSLWDRALQAVPNLRVSRVKPADYKPMAADVIIFDSFEPPTSAWPYGSVLIANPMSLPEGSTETQPVQPIGETGPVPVSRVLHDTPIADAIDLTSVVFPRTVLVNVESWARPVVETSAGPVIMEGTYEGRKVVSFNFDPAQSELPQRIAFPVLVAGTIQWLAPADLPTSLKPEESMDVNPSPSAKEVVVRLPNGRAIAFPARGKPIRFTQTDQIGRYQITQRADSVVMSQHTFIVNVADEASSEIQPRPNALGAGLTVPTVSLPGVQLEWWPYIAALALLVLTGEWWVYCRGRPSA